MFEITRSFQVTGFEPPNVRNKCVSIQLGQNDFIDGQPTNMRILVDPDDGCWAQVPLNSTLSRRTVICHICPMDRESTQHCDITNLCWIAELNQCSSRFVLHASGARAPREHTCVARFARVKYLPGESSCVREHFEELLIALTQEEQAFIESSPQHIDLLYHVTFTFKD